MSTDLADMFRLATDEELASHERDDRQEFPYLYNVEMSVTNQDTATPSSRFIFAREPIEAATQVCNLRNWFDKCVFNLSVSVFVISVQRIEEQ